MYVFDATSLIYLGKADRLEIINELSRRTVVPEPIHEEVVVAGTEAGHADARRVEQTIDAGTVQVVSVPETDLLIKLKENDRLSTADAAVLAVADVNDGTAVMDEEYGRTVAVVEGIHTHGTAYLLLQLLKQGTISAEATQTTIDEMMDAGWYCAPDLYAKICRKIETLA